MKRTSALFIGISLFYYTNTSNAQSVPNSGFEMWHTVGGWFENPDNWNTNNNSIMIPSVVKDTNAYMGSLAMEVGNAAGLKGRAYTMFPLSTHPSAIKVFAKANIVGSDSIKIKIKLYSGGIEADSGYWYSTTAAGSWSLLSIPLTQTSIGCDSIYININGGNNVGTKISVDEFSIDYSSGIADPQNKMDWSLFPNPMDVSCLFTFENASHDPLTLSIYNTLGERMQCITNITTTSVKIEKGNLAKGQYVLMLSGLNGGVLLREKICVN